MIGLVYLAKALTFISAMILIGIPIAVAWASLRGSVIVPAITWMTMLLTGILWTGGAL
jgi:hypothetical protein